MFGRFLFVACFGLAFTGSALALDPSGTAIAVIQSASASGPGGVRALASTRPVYSGDRIRTGGVGQAQIQFLDQTRLVVGPNSSILIDKFVFNPDKTVAGVGIEMTKGAFRFITGNGPKRSYTITTPTATLGIRGTKFDVASGSFGTGVVVFDGAVVMCSRQTGKCATVDRGCGVALVSPDGSFSAPRSNAEKATLLRDRFPLIERQPGLLASFRVPTKSCTRPASPLIRLDGPTNIDIDFSPPSPGPVTPGPPDGGTPGGGTPGGSESSPGASGSTPGASHNVNSKASDVATGKPGNSGNSNAGGLKK